MTIAGLTVSYYRSYDPREVRIVNTVDMMTVAVLLKQPYKGAKNTFLEVETGRFVRFWRITYLSIYFSLRRAVEVGCTHS